MRAWLIDILIQGGVVATASAGLGLHLRLVRFFDLGWTLWVISAAFISVYLTIWFSSPLLGIATGALIGILLGIFQDGIVLRRVLISSIPYEAMERFLFSGALAAYLALASLIEVFGLRDQAIAPASETSWLGLSLIQVAVGLSCWGIIGFCTVIRLLPWSLPVRAMLEDSRTCSLYGMRVLVLAAVIGGLAGLLTGTAAAGFGLMYFAHPSTGFSLMLLAIVPCIIVGPRHTSLIIPVAVATVGIIATVRFYFGYTASDFVIQVLVLALLIGNPKGLIQSRLREI